MRTIPPPDLDRVLKLLDWQKAVHRPTFSGWEHIPDERPLLFVGNHTLLGMLDVPLMYRALWEEKGIFLNALGDRLHFKIPGWRRMLTRLGAVEGSPENLSELFARKACVLVFPGGAREVNKRKGEEDSRVWKQRTGFARLAIEHGVTLVPFAAVGVEDALDIVLDSTEIGKTRVGRWLDRVGLRDDLLPPLVKGIGPTPIPRPERFDFRFCEPVRTEHLGGDPCDEHAWQVRDEVADRIETAIEALREERAARTPAQR